MTSMVTALALKSSASRGGSVYDRDWERSSTGHRDRKRKKCLLQIDSKAFIDHFARFILAGKCPLSNMLICYGSTCSASEYRKSVTKYGITNGEARRQKNKGEKLPTSTEVE